jgi:TonB-dependent SusC/RagA subfamily outer membrane receptor
LIKDNTNTKIMKKIISGLLTVFTISVGMTQQNPSDAVLSGKLVPQLLINKNDNHLKGKITGLNITGRNQSANGIVVRFRCGRSIMGNNIPLFLVDGIRVRNGFLNQLNPNDIESIEVLKSASATAIFGIEGVHGVVIINTKKRFIRVLIADSVNGKPVPYAVVQLSFRGDGYKNRTISADSLGYVAIEKNWLPVLSSVWFGCVGYLGRILTGVEMNTLSSGKVSLLRKIKLCDEVVVSTSSRIICRNETICGFNKVKGEEISIKRQPISIAAAIAPAMVFPNPVKRAGSIHARFMAAKKEAGVMQFITMAGQQVYQLPVSFTGVLQDVEMAMPQQLSAGTYILAIKNIEGKVIVVQSIVVE